MAACRILLAALLLVPLAGCHEREVTRSVHPHPFWLDTPDPAIYGRLAVYTVKEYRKPRGLFRFPDGGVAFELAHYREVRQILPDGRERVIGQLHQQPVRRGDFGNTLPGGGHAWIGENRLRWWMRHGYEPDEVRTDTAEIVIPPLP